MELPINELEGRVLLYGLEVKDELGQSGLWATGYPALSQSLNLLSSGFDPGSL